MRLSNALAGVSIGAAGYVSIMVVVRIKFWFLLLEMLVGRLMMMPIMLVSDRRWVLKVVLYSFSFYSLKIKVTISSSISVHHLSQISYSSSSHLHEILDS